MPLDGDSSVGDIVQTQKAEWSEAVIDRDHDHVAAPNENRSVVNLPRAGADGESAALNPDHHDLYQGCLASPE